MSEKYAVSVGLLSNSSSDSPKSSEISNYVLASTGKASHHTNDRITSLQNHNNLFNMQSEDTVGLGGNLLREERSSISGEKHYQKSIAADVTDDDDDSQDDYAGSIPSDQSSRVSPEQLTKRVDTTRSDRLKFFFQSNQLEPFQQNGLSIPRRLDRHTSGEESIFETERRRHSVIGTENNKGTREVSSSYRGEDINKSNEIHSNSAHCDIGRSSSHNSGLRSNSKRQSLRKAFAMDRLYVPGSNGTISGKCAEKEAEKSHNNDSLRCYDESDSSRLGDLCTIPHTEKDTAETYNQNSSSSYNYSGTFNNNSYTDISFVRPNPAAHVSPQDDNIIKMNNISPPSIRTVAQQHFQSKSQDDTNSTTMTLNNNTTRPQSPRRVLPKHLHQVFGSGAAVSINGAVNSAFISRHHTLAQKNKRREKNRLTQYTSNAVNSSSANFHSSNTSSISNFTSTASSLVNLNNSVVSSSSALLSIDSNTASSSASSDHAASQTDNSTKTTTISPQTYLDTLIRSRGFLSTPTGNDDKAGSDYRKNRTQLDYAGFGFFSVGVARLGDLETLQTLLASGISPNACNEKGESLARIICRRGDYKSLQLLVKYGCDIDLICDDNGRNLLHDACCCTSASSSLVTARVILQYCLSTQQNTKPTEPFVAGNDVQSTSLRLFFRPDNSGNLPLSYIRQEHWGYWLQFLSQKKNEYLPDPTICKHHVERPNFMKDVVTIEHLPVEVACLVASGKVPPEHARRLVEKLYGKNLLPLGSRENLAQREEGATNEGDGKMVITNISDKNQLRTPEGDGEDDASSKGVATLKTIPVPKDQESKFRDIIFYVENTVILEREKVIAGYDKEVDSTAYPNDSFSGIEFYSDTYDYGTHIANDDYNDLISTASTDSGSFKPSKAAQQVRYVNPSDDDVDSTAFPDSVSGIEFYSEQYIPTIDFGFNTSAGLQTLPEEGEVDSTAFPDSVSGVEFYYDQIKRIFPRGRGGNGNKSSWLAVSQPVEKDLTFKGSSHYYDIATNQDFERSDNAVDAPDDSSECDDSYGEFQMSASLCTDTATLGSFDDCSPVRRKPGKFVPTYSPRKHSTQRYVRSMMEEDQSESNNSDSERCIGGSSFNSFLEI